MRSLLLLLVLGLFAHPLYAETADRDLAIKYVGRLKQKALVGIPIYSPTPNTGSIGTNALQIYGTNLRAYYPAAEVERLVASSSNEALKIKLKSGWQDFVSNIVAPAEWAFVAVGWSRIRIEEGDLTLRPGDYVTLDADGTLRLGTVRDPERPRDPQATAIESAADMMAQVRFHMSTKNSEKALAMLYDLADQFPATPAGARATALIEEMVVRGEPDLARAERAVLPATFFNKAADQTPDMHADQLLAAAKISLKQQEPGKAQSILNSLLTQYPQSRRAIEGRELLDALVSATSLPKDAGHQPARRPR